LHYKVFEGHVAGLGVIRGTVTILDTVHCTKLTVHAIRSYVLAYTIWYSSCRCTRQHWNTGRDEDNYEWTEYYRAVPLTGLMIC